ncbi:MAG: S1 RNA-binding domain-containing protein [bacterium]|nr:S1 RNA-binding domain-containing protein [bacterium]
MAKKKGKREDSQPDQHGTEPGDENFEQLMAESFKPVRTIEIGDEQEAYVIGYNEDHVFLDMGTRLDGLLKRSDLSEKQNQTLAEGLTLKVYVTGKGSGTWYCSTRLGGGDTGGSDALDSAAVMALEDAFNNNSPVEGKVLSAGKGGFDVQIMGLKAFCPLSQIDKRYCDNTDGYVNQTYTFVIVRFEEDGNNIVVSRREHLAKEEEKRMEKLWQQVEVDAIYEGTITAVRDFGAFVDIGGIEGLLHVSEISYERIQNAADVLEVGQEMDVLVKNVERQQRKLSLSMKALLEDPWIAAIKKLSVGGEYQGKVLRMKTFGVFVQLFPGVDGMVHISRLGTGRRHQHPKEVVNISDIVTVRVLEIDAENRKISLTMEKEEGDYSKDLERLKKAQDKAAKSSPSHMAGLVDEALKKD